MHDTSLPERLDEIFISEREFAEYALSMLDSLTKLAVALDRTLLARLLAIAAFEARRLKHEERDFN